jgi:carbonic anhydrase/acetyltransferase-like protein (isoleucine patch superfamily)
MIIEVNGKSPRVAKDVFIATDADVIGDVEIGEGSSIWFGAVLRGDENSIRIGSYTNIQDLVVIHVTERDPVEVGSHVTVGHRAIVHACKIGDNSLIGMGSIVMDGAVIGEYSLIGAGSVVTEGTVIPPGSLAFGVPAKVRRELTEEEKAALRKSAELYYRYSKNFK